MIRWIEPTEVRHISGIFVCENVGVADSRFHLSEYLSVKHRNDLAVLFSGVFLTPTIAFLGSLSAAGQLTRSVPRAFLLSKRWRAVVTRFAFLDVCVRGRWRATVFLALVATASAFSQTVSATFFGLCAGVEPTWDALYFPFLFLLFVSLNGV